MFDGQSSVIPGTHRSRPAGHILPVSQQFVSQTDSSENHLPTHVPLKRRRPGDGELLQLLDQAVRTCVEAVGTKSLFGSRVFVVGRRLAAFVFVFFANLLLQESFLFLARKF